MPHLKRFYYESIPVNNKIILDTIQSNHLKNTLRLKPRSLVEVFNNHNESFLAEVSLIPPKSGVELKVLSKISHPSSLSVPDITLGCAIAKGNRMDWLIEKTAEMGLTRLIPIITERTVIKTTGLNKIARWHKLSIAAAKQSNQNSIPDITPPTSFNSLGNLIKDFSLSLIAVPDADKYLPEVLEQGNLEGKILYLIGPEGDFTPDEVATAIKWGAQAVRLPVNSILRVETAAITMLAMLLYQSGKKSSHEGTKTLK